MQKMTITFDSDGVRYEASIERGILTAPDVAMWLVAAFDVIGFSSITGALVEEIEQKETKMTTEWQKAPSETAHYEGE